MGWRPVTTDGSGGGGGLVVPASASLPFADNAARDTWATANLSDLIQNQTIVSVTGTPNVWYLWRGDTNPASYDNSLWDDATPIIQGPAGADGTTTDFSTVGAYELMMPGPAPDFAPMPAGARRLENGTGDFEFDATVIVPQESLQIGFGGVLSSLGALPLFRSFVTGRRGTFAFTYYDKATGTDRTVEVGAADNERLEVQNDHSDTISSGGTLQVATTAAEIISAFIVRPANGVTVEGLRFRLTVDGQSDPFYYWPSRTEWDNNQGQDVTGSGPDNDAEIDLINAPLFILGVSNPDDPVTVNIEYEFDAGSLQGSSAGEPYFAVDRNVVTLRSLARTTELVDGVSSDFTGRTLTITISRGDLPDVMTSVQIPGGAPPIDPGGDTAASITRFEIDGQATSVLAGTTLSGTKTFNFNVNHPEDVNGNLILQQDAAILRNDISPSSNSISQAINSVTLQNNNQAVFQLRGTTNERALIASFFRVRAHLPAEQLFYGQSTDNNPVDVDLSSLSHIESGVDNSVIETGSTTQGNYFIILAPNDHDITSIIDGLGQDVTSIFTRTPDVRTFASVLYTSYVVGPLNAGDSESYTLRV